MSAITAQTDIRGETSDRAAMTLPNFIVIGPGKTGTTWLYHCLREHPQIQLARYTKETVFFTEYYARGMGWYERFFRGCDGAIAIGEVSNTYFFSPAAAERIALHLPDVKLIVFLRHPVDRLVSRYLFQARNGRMKGTLEQAILRNPAVVEENFFDEHIAHYLSRFSRNQILVALHDDLERDARRLLSEVYGFLGVNPDFAPPSGPRRVLAARGPRNRILNRAVKRAATWLRRNDLHWLLSLAKNSPAASMLLTKRLSAGEAAVLSMETRQRLLDLYRPHMQRTATLIGRDLAAWM